MVIKNLLMKLFSTQCSDQDIIQIIQKKVDILPQEDALRYLLELDNHLYSLLGQASVRYGNGIHSKHRHINYHDFFIRHINPNETVPDLGCGNGACSYDIATSVSNCRVIGIDINKKAIDYANSHYKHEGLSFIYGDILRDIPAVNNPVIVLSNVLEHLSDRVEFLLKIQDELNPERFLIRVPIYERDWRVPLKEELGIDYRLDPTHYIEYKKGELEQELMKAGLKIKETEYGWGEKWCVIKSFI